MTCITIAAVVARRNPGSCLGQWRCCYQNNVMIAASMYTLNFSMCKSSIACVRECFHSKAESRPQRLLPSALGIWSGDVVVNPSSKKHKEKTPRDSAMIHGSGRMPHSWGDQGMGCSTRSKRALHGTVHSRPEGRAQYTVQCFCRRTHPPRALAFRQDRVNTGGQELDKDSILEAKHATNKLRASLTGR